MNRLDYYILRQFLSPFVLIITTLTLVIWMTQSLQRVDLILDNGRSFTTFLYLSALIIPSLLVILIPFALFGGCLYALYRMHSDSEIAVIFAAGVSRTRIALPIMIATFLGALATLYVAIDLSPRTYRILKQHVLEIRTDFASSVLKGGEFNTFIDGFTIYIEDVYPGNQFVGLLVSDYRKPEAHRIYMAERGVLRETENGPVLVLARGNVQRKFENNPEIEIFPFSEVSINIDALQSKETLELELTERYLSELLNPNLSKDWDRNNQGKMLAEAHSRLSSPFYAFAYVFIALFALIGGAYNRRGYIMRICFAIMIVVAIRVLGYVTQTFVAENGLQWLQYAVPIATITITIFLLYDIIPTSLFTKRQSIESYNSEENLADLNEEDIQAVEEKLLREGL